MLDKGKLVILILSASIVLYVVIGGFLGKVIARDETYKNLSIYNDVLKKVLDEYVEKPDLSKLEEGSLEGLAQSVDNYSCYLPAKEYDFVRTRLALPGTLGLVLTPRIGYYRVLQVLPGSPAEKAGVLPGDIIEEINQEGISVHSYAYVQALMRGKPGTVIKLGIIRGRDDDLTEFNVPCAVVPPTRLESNILEDHIGYIKILQLHDKSPMEFEKALNTMASNDVDKLVLDLRACSSGTYEAAYAIADMLMDKGLIAIRKGQTIKESDVTASPDKTLFRGPLAVLINGYTSGPAEVIAGAIHDSGRGKLIGMKTYGTASQQKFFELDDGSALYLTFANFSTPDGQSITNEKFTLAGIKPDIKSPEEDFALSLYIDYEMATGEEAQKYYRTYLDSVYKRQLDKAVEILKSGKKKEKIAA